METPEEAEAPPATTPPATTPAPAAAVDRDTAALLHLMHGEVERLRASERTLQESSERADRDAKRTAVMITLSQNQLSAIKDANVALQGEVAVARSAQQAAELAMREREEELRVARDNVHAAVVRGDERAGAADVAARVATATSERHAKAVDLLRSELAGVQQQLAVEKAGRERESRAAFEHKVAIETRLQRTAADLQELEDSRSREGKEAVAREYELSRAVHDLRRQHADVAADLARERRVGFELTAALRAESEQAKLQCAQLECVSRDATQAHAVAAARAASESAMLRERLEEASASAAARERALETQTAKLCTGLMSAQQEVNALANREAALMRDRVEEAVTLHAKNDALRRRVADLEAEVAEHKGAARAAEVQHAAEREELRRVHGVAAGDLAESVAHKAAALQALSHDHRGVVVRLASAEEELRQVAARSRKTSEADAATIAALRAEVDGYRSAVAKLEQHIEHSYELRVLREQNAALEAQCEQLKQRLTHANHTLANARVEADISEGYRLRLLQEQVEAQLGRVATLEKERRAARPLIQGLLELARGSSTAPALVDASLARGAADFVRRFGLHAAAAADSPGAKLAITASASR